MPSTKIIPDLLPYQEQCLQEALLTVPGHALEQIMWALTLADRSPECQTQREHARIEYIYQACYKAYIQQRKACGLLPNPSDRREDWD